MGALGMLFLRASQSEIRLASGTEWHSRITFTGGRPCNARYFMTSASAVRATTEYPERRNSSVLVVCNASSLLIVTTVFSTGGRALSALRQHPCVSSSFSIARRACPGRSNCANSKTRRTLGHLGRHKTAPAKTVIRWVQLWRRLPFLSLGFCQGANVQKCTARVACLYVTTS